MSLVQAIQGYLSHSSLCKETESAVVVGLHIVRLLREAECCYRCCLRFTRCRDMDIYKTMEQHIFDTIEKENYECQSVVMSVTVPLSVLHRNYLMALHIGDHLPAIEGAKEEWEKLPVYDCKDPLKTLLTGPLVDRFGWSVDPVAAPLRLTFVLEHEETAIEHRFLTQVKEPVLKIRKTRQKRVSVIAGESRSAVLEALNALDKKEVYGLTAIPPVPLTHSAILKNIAMVHEPTIVGVGRYLKMSREYSQTPWIIGGKRLADLSVSETIEEKIKEYHRCTSCKFVSAGREDANVRMLGTGRPFYLELINPHKPTLSQEEYTAMEEEINQLPTKADIQVRHLTRIRPADVNIIKQGEEFKRKTYRALVWFTEPVTDEIITKVNTAGAFPFIIYQNTPLRVFQRRSAAVREKEIRACHLDKFPGEDPAHSRFGILTLTTQAGTYIKEFVHGDLGRTLPNLSSLAGVVGADLLELDVMNVDLEWPQ
ncbi:hypothetical protein BDF14DRAFT_1717558 [Spinellus fusiger]|nr:hypothetical protein BDF14DRAFT_1717558 [Spinellus fusiger]